MRVLCDRNVARRYLDTFRRIDWITAVRVDDILSRDASDAEIGAYAAAHDWVVFTSDKRFRERNDEDPAEEVPERIEGCGVVYYRQREKPTPGAIVAAMEAIADVYVDHSEINQYVPGEWARERS